MRLRNIKGAIESVENNIHVIPTPTDYKGKWNELFLNSNPIHIEIGMGKGNFIYTHASNQENINYIGIEKYSSVLYRAVEQWDEYNCNNLFFLRMNADTVDDVFSENEINRIYLNFSDPWPKDRHSKRRLTSTYFLDKYKKILSDDGQLIFKTDNDFLFDFSLEQLKEAGWNILSYTYDLHHSEYVVGNIMTEYEEKFVSLNQPIHQVIAKK